MEEPRLPPTSASASTSITINNEDKLEEPPSTWHRATTSLPHLPSSTSQVFSPPQRIRTHSLNLFPLLSSSPPPPPPPPLPPPPAAVSEIETYVVQVPRDQVYWTHPSENATNVERRVNSESGKKKNKFCCSKRLRWFLIAVIIIGFLICAIALIVRFVFRPKPPVFNVEKLEKSRHFDIFLTSMNPSPNMWVTYGGLVSLTYKNMNIGQGNFPEISQAVYASDKVELKLNESKIAAVSLPEVFSLVLTMKLNAAYGTGLVKRDRKVGVACDVKVNGLLDAKKVEIVSEKCKSEFTK